MANNYWLEQEKKFLKVIEGVDVPNETLDNVDFVEINSYNDFSEIPNGGGCYWIWTNEPVIHSLHKNQNHFKTVKSFIMVLQKMMLKEESFIIYTVLKMLVGQELVLTYIQKLQIAIEKRLVLQKVKFRSSIIFR
jgi:hypothetical protein